MVRRLFDRARESKRGGKWNSNKLGLKFPIKEGLLQKPYQPKKYRRKGTSWLPFTFICKGTSSSDA